MVYKEAIQEITMATIKLYTDIEQSKKLAEILPLESADMFCADVFDKEKETHSYNFHILSTWGCNTFEELKDRENKFVCFIPCWSLAALFGILNENKICHYNDRYYCQYMNEGDEFPIYSTAEYDNPVDACVDMAEKLHKLNLL